MRDDFLLTSPLARELYARVSELPIIDYHNHLELGGQAYSNITELWLNCDPYKHRLMRICGVPESYITGAADDREKFEAWCEIFHKIAGTPVYAWSLMELSNIFDCELIPSRETSTRLWELLNEKIAGLTASDILAKFNIEYASPVASLLDDVSIYAKTSSLAPSIRGDNATMPNPDFVRRLETAVNVRITSLEAYLSALSARINYFKSVNCKFADHALDDKFTYIADDGKNPERFEALLAGREYDKDALMSHILRYLGGEYGRSGLTMQLHFGAIRKTSTRLRELAGPAGGYAAIGEVSIRELVRLLDDIEKIALPRTILFPLNPSQVESTATLAGSFSKDGVSSVVSLGAAWWWCDHRDGIERVLGALTSYASLSSFIGMTTDSRSPLSFVRHDYFRRVVCEWLARRSINGEFPPDADSLGEILTQICYYNAKNIIRV